MYVGWICFQFLGIPPKGEPYEAREKSNLIRSSFQFLGIPPKGERPVDVQFGLKGNEEFPISRDPPEGGTRETAEALWLYRGFPISRDPPEGGTKYF